MQTMSIKLLDDSCTDDLSIDTNELTDVMESDQLLFEREEDFYESYDDGSACEFIFDSQVEAELATYMEEVV
jgi:hypothetical protein